MLETCGSDEDGFADNFFRFSLNNGLSEAIADIVRVSQDKYKCDASLYENIGQLGQ
jgi:hypothetical protein